MENVKLNQLVNGKYKVAELMQRSAQLLREVASMAYAHNIEDEVLTIANSIAVMSYDITDEARQLVDGMNKEKRERIGRWMDGICAELEMRLDQLCFDDLCTVSNDTSGNDVVPSRSLIIESGNVDEARTVYQVFVPNALYDDYPNELYSTFSCCVINWEGEYENTDAVYKTIAEVIDWIYSDMEQRGLNP